MPRLLLVDDNPSIHRIAESLLAPTDVELVCVGSALEALDRLERGERFDVALVDTAMPGMDGWTLLDQLRGMEETARMPIALMAGVLDPVDPAKLAKALIQGFLKKPIELRELGDRVKTLLTTPVAPAPPPFSTVPATSAEALVKPMEEASPEVLETVAGFLDSDLDLVESEEDLLLLTAEDLWPEDPAPPMPEAGMPPSSMSDVHLELEELDLDSLQDLADEPHPAAPIPDDLLQLTEPATSLSENGGPIVDLDELDAFSMDFPPPPPLEPAPGPDEVFDFDEALAYLPDAASLIDEASAPVPARDTSVPMAFEPVPVAHTEPSVLPVPAAGGQAAAAPGQVDLESAAAPPSSGQAEALVQALLADPALMDALAKAVVARLGDQALREIAWEVMPDLAGRLQR